MNKPFGSERRQNVRVSLNVFMRLVVFDASTKGLLKAKDLSRFRNGIIRDISLTGLCLETDDLKENWTDAMLAGEIQIALKFQLKDNTEPIATSAKVMWIKKNADKNTYLVGLRFSDITDSERFQIMQFIIECKTKKKEEKK